MFEKYTEQARRAIFYAHCEAVYQQVAAISTTHLLIGLTRDQGSRADSVGCLKDNSAQLRSELGIPQKPIIPGKILPAGTIPLNNNSKMVLAYAAQEANVDDSYYIDTDHLLRGILRFPNEATAALRSISLDLATAQTISRRKRAEHPEDKTLYRRLFGSPFRAHQAVFLKLLAFIIIVSLTTLLIRWLN